MTGSLKSGLRRPLHLAVCAGVVAMLGAPPLAGAAGTDRVVRIGIDLPVSGIDGAAAIPARNAAVMTVKEANAAGLPGDVKLAVNDLDVDARLRVADGTGHVRSVTFVDQLTLR